MTCRGYFLDVPTFQILSKGKIGINDKTVLDIFKDGGAIGLGWALALSQILIDLTF